MTPPRARRLWIVGGVLLLAGAFAWLTYGNLDSNIVYFLTPTELVAKRAQSYDVPLRLGGQVKPGTVKWDEATRNLTFTLTDTTKTEVAVHSSGAPPQMFRDGMGVVVEGRLARDGVFNSTSLMVKHSNEYRAPKAGEKPQEMYKTLIKTGAS